MTVLTVTWLGEMGFDAGLVQFIPETVDMRLLRLLSYRYQLELKNLPSRTG